MLDTYQCRYSIEIIRFLVYNAINHSRKGCRVMAAVTVKPIQPTIVSDLGIIQDIIREATTTPSPAAVKRNKEASELLRSLQQKQVKNEA